MKAALAHEGQGKGWQGCIRASTLRPLARPMSPDSRRSAVSMRNGAQEPALYFSLMASTRMQADVFDVPAWAGQLDGAVGVISCLGGFGTNAAMYKVGRGYSHPTLPSAHDMGLCMRCIVMTSITHWLAIKCISQCS